MPEMHPFKSSNISAAGYDEQKRELTILFASGGSYVYANVIPEVWEGLRDAPSPGGYFHRNIREIYALRQE